MDRILDNLSHLVSEHFSMHPARLMCFLSLILSMIGAKSVQLWSLAEQFGGYAQIESRIKRIQRFFALQSLCLDTIAQLIMALIAPNKPLILTMDRTNWAFGKIERNYLVLSFVVQGHGVPLLFTDLEQAGNSNQTQRITLMQRFIALFGKDRILCLLADREFIGKEWLTWLQKEEISLCIRQKANLQVRHKNGGKVAVSRLLSSLAVSEKREWIEKFHDKTMRLVGMKLGSGDYLILLADTQLDPDLLPLYKIRWTIETMFKNTKTSGFNCEKTQLKHADRALKMMGIIAIATSLSIKEGMLQNRLKPIPIKQTLNCKAFSFFIYGLRYLSDIIRKIPNLITQTALIDRPFQENLL